jgi:hypothetical protein
VRIADDAWTALAPAVIGGVARAIGDTGAIGDGLVIEIGGYRVRVIASPAGAAVAPPQRTESLARELVRGLLGAGAAPALEVERGPIVGARRELAPPESTLVIGRGGEAGWVILDEDLSRAHAELRRGWDGVTIRDLDSKNGTRVGGVRVTSATELHDGDVIALGEVVMRFVDRAERHLIGTPRLAVAPPPAVTPAPPNRWPFVVAASIAALAVAGLVWILGS